MWVVKGRNVLLGTAMPSILAEVRVARAERATVKRAETRIFALVFWGWWERVCG